MSHHFGDTPPFAELSCGVTVADKTEAKPWIGFMIRVVLLVQSFRTLLLQADWLSKRLTLFKAK